MDVYLPGASSGGNNPSDLGRSNRGRLCHPGMSSCSPATSELGGRGQITKRLCTSAHASVKWSEQKPLLLLRVSEKVTRPLFSVAARALVRLACRMAGQPGHMPHGGSSNNLCHTLGPAHPPDPQVSPSPLSAAH